MKLHIIFKIDILHVLWIAIPGQLFLPRGERDEAQLCLAQAAGAVALAPAAPRRVHPARVLPTRSPHTLIISTLKYIHKLG